VYGEASVGLYGKGEFGVWGEGDQHGVKGWSSRTGVLGIGNQVGVEGISQEESSVFSFGVSGKATVGTGVAGLATTGTALLGRADRDGVALRTLSGHIVFNTSGLAVISSGQISVTVTPGFDISEESKVLAVLQGDPGKAIALRCVVRDPANDRFTIVLSHAARVATPVAWFVLR
jgi:hypothetical protein